MFFPKLLIPTLKDNFNCHILIQIGYMLKVIPYPSVSPLLLLIILLYHFIKFLMIDILHILIQIFRSSQKQNIIGTVFWRFILPQIVFCYSKQFTLTCYGTLSIANVCRVRNITHRHLSFLLKSDFPLAYHLGSAEDDNPLADLSHPMCHCLRQICGGSPRVTPTRSKLRRCILATFHTDISIHRDHILS